MVNGQPNMHRVRMSHTLLGAHQVDHQAITEAANPRTHLTTPTMNVFRIKRILKVPQKVMLNVVGDVSKYHQFVPYCTESVITQHFNSIPSRARLSVGWNGLSDSFESILEYTDNSVVASVADTSLFEKLACTWTVLPISSDKCNASLDLEFKFCNSVYNAVAGKAGPLVAKKMIQAFSERAMEVR